MSPTNCRCLLNRIWIILEMSIISEVRSQYWELNLDYIEGRQVLSPLGHAFSPNESVVKLLDSCKSLCFTQRFSFISFQNIRVMAKYYTRITLKRMSQLLDLSVDVSYFIPTISHDIFFFSVLEILKVMLDYWMWISDFGMLLWTQPEV